MPGDRLTLLSIVSVHRLGRFTLATSVVIDLLYPQVAAAPPGADRSPPPAR